MNSINFFSTKASKPNFSKIAILGYIPAFDGLRAIAVLLVLLQHDHLPLGHNGFIGVEIFFVLSGFLITTLLLEEINKTNTISIKNFFIRRVFRLLPVLYVVLLSILVLNLISPEIFKTTQIYLELIATAFQFQNLIPSLLWEDVKFKFFFHAWTLGAEWQFYLIWPWIFYWFLKNSNLKTLTIFLVITFVLVYLNKVYKFNAILGIFEFSIILGCIGAILRFNGFFNFKIPPLLTLFCLTFLVIEAIFTFDYDWFNNNIYTIGRLINSFVALILIFGVINLPNETLISKILNKKLLIEIGKISYSLYLWHVPVFEIFNWFKINKGLPQYLTVFLMYGTSFLLAILTWNLIEKHSINIGRNIISKAKKV